MHAEQKDINLYAQEIHDKTNGKTRLLTDVWEQREAITKCIRWKDNRYGKPSMVFQNLCTIVESRMFDILEYNRGPICSKYRKIWEEKNGTWMHGGGYTREHNDLGMRWAGERLVLGDDIRLGDSPDIRGELHGGGIIYGDVGNCSFFPAFVFGALKSGLTLGDMWVSVFENMEYIWQVAVSPDTNVTRLYEQACGFEGSTVIVRP